MLDLDAMRHSAARLRIAAVIPSYKVASTILDVIAAVPPLVDRIYVVDDCCPEGSGRLVREQCSDLRVAVIVHERNLGVGGAVVSGYRAAIDEGFDIVVKIDGDGQMDPSLVAHFVKPIALGLADYTKGNRFYSLEMVREMPGLRLYGNAAVSFLTKLSTGYWRTFDPTNGYTAVHREVLRLLPLDRLVTRFFFESEMLFRLGTMGAKVVDVPMYARYGRETSNLRISDILGEFAWKHLANTGRRIVYNYFLRDFSIATVELVLGFLLLLFGLGYGGVEAAASAARGVTTPAGTVGVAIIAILLGIQLLLAFLAFDIARTPAQALHPGLASDGRTSAARRVDPARHHEGQRADAARSGQPARQDEEDAARRGERA